MITPLVLFSRKATAQVARINAWQKARSGLSALAASNNQPG